MNKIIYEKAKKVCIACIDIRKRIDEGIKRRENKFLRWFWVKTGWWSNRKKAAFISV